MWTLLTVVPLVTTLTTVKPTSVNLQTHTRPGPSQPPRSDKTGGLRWGRAETRQLFVYFGVSVLCPIVLPSSCGFWMLKSHSALKSPCKGCEVLRTPHCRIFIKACFGVNAVGLHSLSPISACAYEIFLPEAPGTLRTRDRSTEQAVSTSSSQHPAPSSAGSMAHGCMEVCLEDGYSAQSTGSTWLW